MRQKSNPRASNLLSPTHMIRKCTYKNSGLGSALPICRSQYFLAFRQYVMGHGDCNVPIHCPIGVPISHFHSDPSLARQSAFSVLFKISRRRKPNPRRRDFGGLETSLGLTSRASFSHQPFPPSPPPPLLRQ